MSYRRNKEQKITDIQKAFTELINTQGYEKTTIRQIAKKAENSVGIIYRYYPEGKPSIAAAIYEENIRRTTASFEYGVESDKIDEILINHLQVHKENIELYKAFDQAILADHDIFESVKRNRKKILLEHAEEQGHSIESVDMWLKTYNIIDAVIHRHLYIEKVCETDKELLKILNDIYNVVSNP
jgi:AcrR family transcriptional regulator